MPAISAWAATCTPYTRCRCESGCRPRNRSASMSSRSRRSTSSSVALRGTRSVPRLVGVGAGVRAVQPREKLLELPADLLAGRQRLVAGEQAAAALLGALEGVV